MYVLNKKEIKELLSEGDTNLRYSFGQNYLTSSRSIKAFINNFATTDQIVEIGAGIGNISINYFQQAGHVFLIEIDKEKIPILEKTLTQFNHGIFPSHVEIVNKDILDLDIASIINPKKSYQIVGALPYNISKKIIRNIFSLAPPPKQCTFIVQREVADKYTDKKPDASFLSISTEAFATVKKREIIKKNEFFPSPKVDSRIIVIKDFSYASSQDIEKLEGFVKFVKKGFSAPRKKLSSSLRKLLSAQVTEGLLQKRPQELDFSDWETLYRFAKE